MLNKKNIVVLGGGFAGVEAAISLKKDGFDVLLISDRDFIFIYPMAIWIPVGEKAYEDVCLSLAELAHVHKFELLIDEVTSIKNSENLVYLKNSAPQTYSYLIVAMGADRLKADGMEHTQSVCGKPKNSLQLKENLDGLIKKGSGSIAIGFGDNPIDSFGVRGTPAFELVFNIHNMLKKQNIRDKFELNFFTTYEQGDEQAAKELKKSLTKLKINAVFQTLKSFTAHGISFEDGSFLKSDMTIFIPAKTGHKALASSDLPLSSAGFIKIDHLGNVLGMPNIYAAGDIACIEGPQWRVKQGYLAEIMAKDAAFNIFSIENNSDARRSYLEHPSMMFIVDTGTGGSLIYRNENIKLTLNMSIVGHWIKKGWGRYYKLSRLKKIPRFAGA